jgi:hypothetical protein
MVFIGMDMLDWYQSLEANDEKFSKRNSHAFSYDGK